MRPSPLVLAIDGRSGVGKSTLAEWLAEELSASLIEGDDFYAGGTEILGDPPASRAARCIDWQTQRRVLSALREGKTASYQAFDWDAFDGVVNPRQRKSNLVPSFFSKESTLPDQNCGT